MDKKILICSKNDDGLEEDEIDNEIMINNHADDSVHLLNYVASKIWNYITIETKVSDIENYIYDLFQISNEKKKEVSNDIQEILFDFYNKKLIEIELQE